MSESRTHVVKLDSGRHIRLLTPQPRVWVVVDVGMAHSHTGPVIGAFAHLEQAWHVAEAHIEDEHKGRPPEQVSITIQEWQAGECLNELTYTAVGWVKESWQTPGGR